jgi:hypothetical protein
MKKYDLSNYVQFKGSVDYLKSLELMKTADYLILIDAPSETKSIFFPSKLVDYIGANKPIVVISPDGTSRRVALENDISYFTLEQTEDISKFLDSLSKDNIKSINYDDSYDIKNNILEFERIINK